MAQVELSDKELTIVVEVLESAISELKTEIGHTDKRDYRLGLKDRETLLEGVLSRLGSPPQA